MLLLVGSDAGNWPILPYQFHATKRADLVVVDGDPLSDLRALRRIRWTVKDGVARTPQEWMTP